uniref:7TM_GPCR_Srx domain-containing protein n=1 Tax=Heterorhabditis bacteriophora TaxID=37862 RepID=A0A1I7XD93_HETBA
MSSACELDGWSCGLFSLEMLLNLLYIPLTGLLFYFDLAPLQYMGGFIGLFGWMFVVAERATASMISARYEHQCRSLFFPIMLWAANGILAGLATFIKIRGILPYFDYYLLGFQIISVVTNLLGLLVIVHHNSIVYKARHSTMMQLTDRYQVDEIIRATKYVLPAAVGDLISKTGASARVFFGATMVLRSEKFDFLLKRGKRSNQVVANEANLASNHFDELREMWA